MPTTLRGRRITITIRETPLNPLLVDGYAFASKTTRVFEHEEGFLGKFQKGSAIVVLIAVLSLVAVVSAFGGSSSSAATSVAVTAGKPAEFRFTLSKKTVAKGVTTFKVTNKGSINHDFKIGGKKTPSLKRGKTASITVTFKKAGKYAYLCTLPGHAAGGMKGTFTVK